MCGDQNAIEWGMAWMHVMIVGSGAKMLDGYPRDAKADPTKPYASCGLARWRSCRYFCSAAEAEEAGCRRPKR